MRYALLADIHGNLAAFETVLADARSGEGFDAVLCPGDIVGYGPDPAECIALLRKHEHVAVAGNHDWAAAGKLDTSDFNRAAAAANAWTTAQLSPEEIAWLQGLPLTAVCGPLTMVHGSPRDPTWEYLTDLRGALDNFAFFTTPYCLVGHSHTPAIFEQIGGTRCVAHRVSAGEKFRLGGERLIINPGGVGQPRDGDPRAAYALYDTDKATIQFRRVSYDIASVQARMRRARLPEPLISRLSEGF